PYGNLRGRQQRRMVHRVRARHHRTPHPEYEPSNRMDASRGDFDTWDAVIEALGNICSACDQAIIQQSFCLVYGESWQQDRTVGGHEQSPDYLGSRDSDGIWIISAHGSHYGSISDSPSCNIHEHEQHNLRSWE